MSAQPEPRDFYFEDESPDGFHEYRLSTTGKGTPELYRDGKKIRQVLDPDFVKSNKLLEDRVLEVLELFVRNAGKKLSRQKDFRFDVQPYVTRLRKLFNDTEEPHRVIKKAGVGEVVFNLKVRDTPSLYRATYRADLKDHWKPYAMGSGALFHGGHWYFCGRNRALNHICEWLSQPSSGASARVVTGDPGSGKSAVLGYLVTCSDPTEVTGSDLARFLATMPMGAIPRPRILDFAFNLRDRTLAGTLAIVADALRCDAEDVVSVLANWQGNIRLVFDSIDQAAEPAQIARLLLRPLVAYDHLWLLVGSRRPELSRLGDSVVVLDLDGPDFQADTDLARYVERILIAAEERRRSPYRDDPASARRAAEAVSTAVRGNFLVAFIVARTLVDRTTVLDPVRERIPRTPKEAFDEYLHRLGDRSGVGYAPLCRAFIPLAHAKGQGLPREVWALMTKEDVDTLLEIAAAFIPEYREDGHTVYRFFHAALAEALREPEHEREQHKIITETLIEAVPEHNWLFADWYTRKYLAIHGAQANSLDALLLDTKFLAVAYVPQLLTVIGEVISPEARRRANWYRLCADRLVDMSVGDRLGQLELTARQQGAPDLARSAEIREVSRPWRTRWATWAPATPHRVIRNVQTLAVAIQGGTIVSAGWHVQRLDLQSGTLLGVPITSPIGQITKLAICNGIILGGTAYTGELWRWDLATGEIIGPFIQAHPEHGISAIAASGNVIASASDDSTIRLWDPRSGEPLLNPIIAHERTVKAIAIKDSVLVSVGEDHVMKFWDLRNGSLLRDPVDGEFTEVAISGHFVLTSNGSYPAGKMRRWNLHTGLEVGNPFGPSEYHLTMTVHDEIAISGGHDGLITLWEVPTGRQVGPPLYGHEAQIEGIAVSGGYIVSTSRDNTLRIWNRRTTEPIGSPEWARSAYRMGGDSKPDGGVRSLGITDGVLVSAVDEDIELRSADSGQLLCGPLRGHTHDVDAVATDEAVIASADKNNVIRLWGREDGGLIREISSGHQYGIDALAVNQGRVVSAGTDSVRVWELTTGNCTSIQVGGASAVTMTDQIIVAAGSDRAIRLWNRHTGELIGEPLRGHKSGIYRVEVHDDRIVSASWDHTIREWHKQTGRQLNGPFPDDGIGVTALAAGSDRVVIAYNDCSLQVLDRDGTPVFDPWRAHEDKVAALAMQGGFIVSGGRDNKVRIWDVLTGRAVGSPMSHGSSVAAVAVAGDIVVSAGWDGKMSLWDLKTCQRIAKQLGGHEGPITSLFVRGDLLISAGWDRTIRRWDLNSFQSIGAPMRGHTAALYGVAVCRETIVSGSYDKTLRLWNVRTGDPICDPLPADARALAVAGDIIIAAGAGLYRVDSVTGRSEFSSNPHPAEITSIAVGSNLIVTGSEDNGVGAWDSQTLSGLWSYGDNAMSLPEALRTDGFYSGRLDWMLSVWDPKAPRRIVEITGDAIHRRYSGDAKIARLYDRDSGHTIATVRLGFVVNNAMFRGSGLYLGCRHGLLRIDFPSEI